MQVELTPENEKLIEEYRKGIQETVPSYNASTTQIANWMIQSALEPITKKKKK